MEKFVSETQLKKDNELNSIVEFLQEALVIENLVYIDVREIIGSTNYLLLLVNLEESLIENISIKQYLISREHFIDPQHPSDILTLNFKPSDFFQS